jgi:hypothetical protein
MNRGARREFSDVSSIQILTDVLQTYSLLAPVLHTTCNMQHATRQRKLQVNSNLKSASALL